MTAFRQRTGYHAWTINKHFPELCKSLSERSRQHRAMAIRKRLDDKIAEFRKIDLSAPRRRDRPLCFPCPETHVQAAEHELRPGSRSPARDQAGDICPRPLKRLSAFHVLPRGITTSLVKLSFTFGKVMGKVTVGTRNKLLALVTAFDAVNCSFIEPASGGRRRKRRGDAFFDTEKKLIHRFVRE